MYVHHKKPCTVYLRKGIAMKLCRTTAVMVALVLTLFSSAAQAGTVSLVGTWEGTGKAAMNGVNSSREFTDLNMTLKIWKQTDALLRGSLVMTSNAGTFTYSANGFINGKNIIITIGFKGRVCYLTSVLTTKVVGTKKVQKISGSVQGVDIVAGYYTLTKK